jgi:hypothetical protein
MLLFDCAAAIRRRLCIATRPTCRLYHDCLRTRDTARCTEPNVDCLFSYHVTRHTAPPVPRRRRLLAPRLYPFIPQTLLVLCIVVRKAYDSSSVIPRSLLCRSWRSAALPRGRRARCVARLRLHDRAARPRRPAAPQARAACATRPSPQPQPQRPWCRWAACTAPLRCLRSSRRMTASTSECVAKHAGISHDASLRSCSCAHAAPSRAGAAPR